MSDAQQATITVDGVPSTVTAGTTGTELFDGRREIVVMRVDGVLKDLDQPVPAGAVVEGVEISSEDGLNVLRHSTAHVMAQAVQQLRPGAKLGIGPYIKDGFYFDFDVEEPFTPEDLRTLEKMMLKIVNQNQVFRRRVVTAVEAGAEMADEPYKLIILDAKDNQSDGATKEGANVEVGAGEITIYDNVDRKSGDVIWCDLCRGPHLPNTKLISNAFALTRSAAAYWLGSEKNKQLQRIYGTAWPTKEALKEYQDRIARPSAAITASWARSWTCSPSPTSSARACRCSTPRAASSSARWKTTCAAGTSRRDSSTSGRRTSPRTASSTPRATSRTTPTRCSRRCTSTRSATTRATSPSRARTTASRR